MGGTLGRFCAAVTRKKTVETPAPGLRKNLTLVDLAAVGASSCVGVGGYVFVGVGAAEWAGPSMVLSVLLAAVSAILTGAVCGELGGRFPRAGGIFTHVYATLGELPAVLLASTLLLDLILIPAIAARSSSQYLDVATNHSLSGFLEHRLPLLQDSRYLAPHCDLLAAALVLTSTLMVVAGTKVVCQVGAVGSGASLLVLTAASCTALLGAHAHNWTHPPGFFPNGLHGVVSGGAMLSVGVAGAHQAGLLAGECPRYGRVAGCVGVGVGVLALLSLFLTALAATLATATQVSIASLTHMFPGASLAGMRALVAMGAIAGLWSAIVSSLLAGSRLTHMLACEGLAPRWLRPVSRRTATPWAAALVCGTAAALTSALCSWWALLRLAGAGGVSAGLAGAAAVLARRYQPHTTHPLEVPPIIPPPPPSRTASLAELTEIGASSSSSSSSSAAHASCNYDDSQPRQMTVEWVAGAWVSTVIEPPTPPTWCSWRTARFLIGTYITNCVAGVGVVRAAGELGIGVWAWAGLALCVGGCVVCGVGLWLQPHHPPPSTNHQEFVPFLPLLAILTSIALLLHLPHHALTAAFGVCVVAGAVWLVEGRTSSMEAALARALLTHSGQDSPDLL